MEAYTLQRGKRYFWYIPWTGARNRTRNGDEGAVLDEADFRVSRGVEFRWTTPRYGCCLRLALPRPGVFYNFGAVVDYVSHASSQIIRVSCESDGTRILVSQIILRYVTSTVKRDEGATRTLDAFAFWINLQNKHSRVLWIELRRWCPLNIILMRSLLIRVVWNVT